MGGIQSYKGFGLALILDLLSGGLSGGQCSHPGAPAARGNDVMFLALDPSHFSGRETLQNQASHLAEYVRSTPRAPGVEAVLLPGDPERRTLQLRSAQGISLEENHWRHLVEAARKLEVTTP
jgi:uncharacterized oxidoreductase